MTGNKNRSDIIPIGLNSLVRAGNSIDITNKLLIRSDFQFTGDFKGIINWTFCQKNKIIGIAYFQSKVVCLFENNLISFLDPTDGIKLFEWEIPVVDDSPTTLKAFNDEYLFIGTRKGKVIKLDENETFTEVLNLNQEITVIQFSNDNLLMAIQDIWDTTIWQVNDFKLLQQIDAHYCCGFYEMFFHSNNTHLIGIGRDAGDGGVFSVNIQNNQFADSINYGCHISINYSKGLVVIGGDWVDEINKIQIRDLNSWDIIFERIFKEEVSRVVISPNGNYIIIGFISGLCQIIDTVKYQIVASIQTNVHFSLQDFTFSSDSKKIFGYGRNDNKIYNII